MTNRGLPGSLGGSLLLETTVNNAGGLIEANAGNVSLGGIQGLGIAIQGGSLATSNGGAITVFNGTMLDGATAGALTLTAGAKVTLGSSQTLAGAVVNRTALALLGNAAFNCTSTLNILGLTSLSGGGWIESGALLTNEAAGIVSAQGGTLHIDNTATINRGQLRALGGTLDLAGGIDDSGGTIAALNDGAGTSGIVLLDAVTIKGGTLASDTKDAASLSHAGSTGTLDGATCAVTIARGADVVVDHQNTLTLTGQIIDVGTVTIIDTSPIVDASTSTLAIIGATTLSGGGTVVMTDATGHNIYRTQVIADAAVPNHDTLDNAGVAISGVGEIGDASLTFVNGAAGVVSASGGTLAIANGATNAGLLRAMAGGTLLLQSGLYANGRGTIAASGGTVLLNNATVTGGTLTTSACGLLQAQTGTLDGTTGAVTLAAGAHLLIGIVGQNSSLTVAGTITNASTIQIQSADTLGHGAAMVIAGTVRLGGGGYIAMSDSTGASGDWIVGASTAAALVNVNNAIAGSGRVGNGTLSLSNGGLIEATSASLQLSTDLGGQTLTNTSTGKLLAAGAGGLALSNLTLANTGTLAAADRASVVLATSVTTSNLSAGTLSGGGWMATAAGHGATLDITAGAVTTDAANIVLSGAGSVFAAWNGSAYQDIATSLATVAASGTLSVPGARGYTTTLAMTDNGHIALAGGSFQASKLTLGKTGQFSGFGTLKGALANAGTVQASGGLLTLAGAVTGVGALSIQNVGTLELVTGAAETVSFASGAIGMLKLDTPAKFLGPIAGLAVGDAIDFTKATATNPVLSAGTLDVVVGGKMLSFDVSGALADNHFAGLSDHAGGTELVLTAGASVACLPAAFGHA